MGQFAAAFLAARSTPGVSIDHIANQRPKATRQQAAALQMAFGVTISETASGEAADPHLPGS
jgi:hypothetical protein